MNTGNLVLAEGLAAIVENSKDIAKREVMIEVQKPSWDETAKPHEVYHKTLATLLKPYADWASEYARQNKFNDIELEYFDGLITTEEFLNKLSLAIADRAKTE